MKKIFSAIIILAMVCSLSAPAFAAQQDVSGGAVITTGNSIYWATAGGTATAANNVNLAASGGGTIPAGVSAFADGQSNTNISFAGNSTVAGSLGDLTGGSLTLVTLAGAGSTVSVGGSSYVTTTNFSGTANASTTLSLASGVNLTGNITNTTSNTGTLSLANGSHTITGDVGSTGVGLSQVNVGTGNTYFNGNVKATAFTFTGNGGFVEVGAGNSITAPITVSVDGASTIQYDGTTTISSDIGASGGNKFAYVNLNGGTVTLGANIYTSNSSYTDATTSVNGANLNLTGNRTIGGKLTLIGNGSITGTGNKLTVSGTGGYFDMQSGSASAILDGAVALTKSTVGTVTLSGVNTYTGITTISGGTLSVTSLTNSSVAGNLGAATGAAGNIVFDGGTLQVTGTGVSTDRNYHINTNKTAIIDVTNDLTVSGASDSSNGALTKVGNGTLIITGANLATGTTTISAGTLQVGNGGATGSSLTAAVVDNAALKYDLSADRDITCPISGTGTFEQAGAGSAIKLSGSNTYTGATTVSAGILRLGAAGALGDGTHNTSGVTVSNLAALDLGGITPTANVALNLNGTTAVATVGALTNSGGAATYGGAVTLQSASSIGGLGNMTLSNTISGAFGLSKVGIDTLILTGATNGSTTTTISAGTLQIGNGLTTGTLGSGSVTDTSALKFNRSDAITVANGISGVGTLEQAGSGTLTINTANNYSGGTTISAGILQVGDPHAIGTGAVTNNAALSLGTTSLVLGSTYAQTAGILNLTANSSLGIGNISSAAATFTGANTLNVTAVGYFANGTVVTLLDTNGAGVTGSAPATVTTLGDNSFQKFSDSVSGDGNKILGTVTRSGANSFAGVASNANGAAVGGVLDNITNPSTDMTTVLNALNVSSASQVAQSENSMTPTVDGAITQSAEAMLNSFTNNLTTHRDNTRATGDATGVATGDDYLNGIDVWAQGLGDYAHQDSRGSSNGYNATSWGVSGGLDKALYNDQIRLGLGTGYGQTFVNSKDFSGSTDINSIPATIYCGYTNNDHPFYIDAAFTFIYNLYSGSRQVTAGPTITRTANADYEGEQYSGYLEGGYSFFYKKLSLTPLASFQYMHLHTGSYTETNAGALSLNVASQDYDMAQTGLGAKMAYPLESKYGTFTPDLHFKWLYDWVGDNQATTAGFSGGGTSFGTNGFSPAQSEWDLGAKLDFKTKYDVTIGVDYDFLLKDDYYEHYGTVDVKYSF